jgi:hypothetical protein
MDGLKTNEMRLSGILELGEKGENEKQCDENCGIRMVG